MKFNQTMDLSDLVDGYTEISVHVDVICSLMQDIDSGIFEPFDLTDDPNMDKIKTNIRSLKMKEYVIMDYLNRIADIANNAEKAYLDSKNSVSVAV